MTSQQLEERSQQLEARVAALEMEVQRLRNELPAQQKRSIPWWEKVTGTFAESEGFEEAMQFGREYRESLRPVSQDKPDQD